MLHCQTSSQGLSSSHPLEREWRDPCAGWARSSLTTENIREGFAFSFVEFKASHQDCHYPRCLKTFRIVSIPTFQYLKIKRVFLEAIYRPWSWCCFRLTNRSFRESVVIDLVPSFFGNKINCGCRSAQKSHPIVIVCFSFDCARSRNIRTSLDKCIAF